MTADHEILSGVVTQHTHTECEFTVEEYDRLTRLMRSQEPSTVNGYPNMVLVAIAIEGDQGRMTMRAEYRDFARVPR